MLKLNVQHVNDCVVPTFELCYIDPIKRLQIKFLLIGISQACEINMPSVGNLA